MNENVNKFLLVGDKSMPEMHLKQPAFTYSACGPFTKNKDSIEKFIGTGNTNFIYKNKLDKACFQHDMAYGKTKDLVKRTQSDKFLKNKAFKILSNPKYDGYQRGLASIVYTFFDKKSKGSGIVNEPSYQLANELHKPKGSEAEAKGRIKPDKIWVDQNSEFYSNTFKDFLRINNIEM